MIGENLFLILIKLIGSKKSDVNFSIKQYLSKIDSLLETHATLEKLNKRELKFPTKLYNTQGLNKLTKFTSSSKSTGFKDIFISQMIKKTVPISRRIVISYAVKQGIMLWIWWKVNGNWDNNMIRFPQWRESCCRRITSIRRNK